MSWKRGRAGLTLALLVGVLVATTVYFIAFRKPAVSNPVGQCPLSLVRRILIPNTIGRVDHMDLDALNDTLYVAMLGNNSLAVVDLQAGKLARSVASLSEPQGVLFVRSAARLLVTNGGDGLVDVLDSRTLGVIQKIALSSDADNIRYDSSSGLAFVGYGTGGVASINASTNQIVGRISLPGHPESFQIEERGHRIFINVPEGNYVAVADRFTDSILARWPLPNNTAGNFAMALDETNHRLFVGSRNPAELIVLDTNSGNRVTSLSISDDPDDIYYDPKGCIYISAGQGYVDVIKQQDPNDYTLESTIPTAAGARTSLLATQLDTFYVAAPNANGTATLYVYHPDWGS